MEAKSASFRIPIEDFEINDENKSKFQDLLANHNLRTKKQYKNIKESLKEAIKKGDIDLVEILLNEEIEEDGIVFKINKNNKTASLCNITNYYFEFIVPRSIKHNSEDYIITSILNFGQNTCTQTLKFDDDSEIDTIYENSFSSKSIKHIFLPTKIRDLRPGWISADGKLEKIDVSPFNSNYTLKDDQFLLGKTDTKSDNFDILIFACRDIEEATIPSNIKIISSFAFCSCKELETVEFEANSELQIIDECSFKCSRIKEIRIPKSVVEIKKRAFHSCQSLKKVEIPEDSMLESIGEKAFYQTGIARIFFPEHLKKIGVKCFKYSKELKTIDVSPKNDYFLFQDDKYLVSKSDNKSANFDILLFSRYDLHEAIIPSNIKIISSYAFFRYYDLIKVVFPENSELEIIDEHAFSEAEITSVSIPKKVSKIGKYAFYKCENLVNVEFSNDSELQFIDDYAFKGTKIDKISIPAKVTRIGKFAFHCCKSLKNIEIPTNSELQIIYQNSLTNTKIKSLSLFMSKHIMFKDDKYLLGKTDPKSDNFDILLAASYDIEIANIPSNIKIISLGAFNGCSLICKTKINKVFIPQHVSKIEESTFSICDNLETVEFDVNSELQIICIRAFFLSRIKEIKIPKSVIKIKKNAFDGCQNIKKVEIPEDSMLESIGEKAFCQTGIERIFFPEHLKKVGMNCFEDSKELKIIDISPKNNNFLFQDDKYLVSKSDNKSSNFDILLFSRSDLREAIIPSNIKIISSHAFPKSLSRVKFQPNSELQIIKEYAFAETKIYRICIPQHVIKIESFAFYKCQNLKLVDIPINSELTTIKDCAFKESGILEIFIPQHVTGIGCEAFRKCKYLSTVDFQSNSELKVICDKAFKGSDIIKISIPKSVSYIGEKAFGKNISIVNIPNDSELISFGKGTFVKENCRTVTIPQKVQIIGKNSFFYFKELKSVLFPENSQLKIIENHAFHCSSLTKIVIPQHVSIIEEGAFKECDNLQSIEFAPNSELKRIGSFAFSDTKIEKFQLPPHVSYISFNVFTDCRELRVFEIPENSELKYVDSCIFKNTKVEKIFIPASVKMLAGSFTEARYLKKIEISPLSTNIIYKDGKYLLGKTNSKSDIFDILFYPSPSVKKAVIPSSIKRICQFAFYNNNNITEVEFPVDSELQIIEYYSFKDTNIQSIIIPPKTTIISIFAFESCTKLRIAEIPESLQSFSKSSFYKCPRLTLMLPVKFRTSIKKE